MFLFVTVSLVNAVLEITRNVSPPYISKSHAKLLRSFDHFATHLHTNTVGPIIVAQKLLQLYNVSTGAVAFISSDSGSTGNFLAFEDGCVNEIHQVRNNVALNMSQVCCVCCIKGSSESGIACMPISLYGPVISR